MLEKCEFCGYWKPPVKDGYATCTHRYVGKRSMPVFHEVNALLLRSDRPAEVEVLVGKNFGCVHFSKGGGSTADAAKINYQVTPSTLRQILIDNNMKQVELARKLHVRPQRVSDWLAGRRGRKIPSLAVTALKAMGLL